ncbi:hypothetical protein EGT07_11315 [Herbaspirillum sp. HC18]|nr:hypothetical protein EGT07_11315 [Herbaspirillum sp. HC18]
MPEQDNDSTMLRMMGNAITDLQVKFRRSTLEDQAILKVPLMEMLDDFGVYQARLLKAGTITTEDELSEMRAIAMSISDKANRQEMLLAISKIVALIAAA